MKDALIAKKLAISLSSALIIQIKNKSLEEEGKEAETNFKKDVMITINITEEIIDKETEETTEITEIEVIHMTDMIEGEKKDHLVNILLMMIVEEEGKAEDQAADHQDLNLVPTLTLMIVVGTEEEVKNIKHIDYYERDDRRDSRR